MLLAFVLTTLAAGWVALLAFGRTGKEGVGDSGGWVSGDEGESPPRAARSRYIVNTRRY